MTFVVAAMFLSGVSMATFAGSALFFFKFWRASRDPFFCLFSLGCGLLALERVVVLFVNPTLDPLDAANMPYGSESTYLVYSVRLLAFMAILLGIWIKNRPANR
jgi:hypothetical protein